MSSSRSSLTLSSATALPRRFLPLGLPSAACLLLLCTSALAEEPAEQDASPADDGAAASEGSEVVISEKARSHFRAGVNLLQDPDGARYEEAYRQFEVAYEDSPSWKILSNLGLTAMKLERDGEAIEAFETYLREGGEQLSAEERAQIVRDLETLAASVATLKITASPEGVRLLDERISAGRSIINEYVVSEAGPLVLRVRAGRHKITARASGREDQVWEFQAPPASAQEHSFELVAPVSAEPATATSTPRAANEDAQTEDRPPQGGTSGMRIGSYVAFGVGAAGLGFGTFFALDSKKAADRVETVCGGDPQDCQVDPGSPEEEEVNTKNDQAGKSQTLAIVGFAVGGAAIATGVTLLVLSLKNDKSTAQLRYERDTQRHWTPYVGLGELGLTGRF